MLSGGDVVCDFVNSDADSHIGSEYIMVGIDLHFDKLSIGGSSTLCKSEEDRKTSLLLCPPPPPAGVRSIAINVSSCLSVCSHIPKKTTRSDFTKFSIHVACVRDLVLP